MFIDAGGLQAEWILSALWTALSANGTYWRLYNNYWSTLTDGEMLRRQRGGKENMRSGSKSRRLAKLDVSDRTLDNIETRLKCAHLFCTFPGRTNDDIVISKKRNEAVCIYLCQNDTAEKTGFRRNVSCEVSRPEGTKFRAECRLGLALSSSSKARASCETRVYPPIPHKMSLSAMVFPVYA